VNTRRSRPSAGFSSIVTVEETASDSDRAARSGFFSRFF
jgi:hypothetical protein